MDCLSRRYDNQHVGSCGAGFGRRLDQTVPIRLSQTPTKSGPFYRLQRKSSTTCSGCLAQPDRHGSDNIFAAFSKCSQYQPLRTAGGYSYSLRSTNRQPLTLLFAMQRVAAGSACRRSAGVVPVVLQAFDYGVSRQELYVALRHSRM